MTIMKVTLVNHRSSEPVQLGGTSFQIRSKGNIHYMQREMAQSLGVPLPEQHLGWEMLWKQDSQMLNAGEEMTIEFETYELKAFILTEYVVEGQDANGLSVFSSKLSSDEEWNGCAKCKMRGSRKRTKLRLLTSL